MRISRIAMVALVLGLGCDAAKEARFKGNALTVHADRFAEVTSPKATAGAPAPSSRKIIRNLDVRMRVKDVDSFLRAIEELARNSGGYVADRNVERQANGGRAGSVTVRVASAKVDGAGEALHAIGAVESESLKAEDISEQYYDLEARIHNAQLLEARLATLLADKTGKLPEIMEVEAKLATVRESIEQLQGKQRRWDEEVALATVKIAFYVEPPSAPVLEAGFGSELAGTVRSSSLALLSIGRFCALCAAAALPWMPVALALLFVRWIFRRRRVNGHGS